MKTRYVRIFCFATLIAVSSCFKLFGNHEDTEEKSGGLFSSVLQKKPRIFDVFSKPLEKEPELDIPPQKETIFGHIGNVLHGGTIGMQMRPMAPVHGFIEHAKKVIPDVRGILKKPHLVKSPRKDHDDDYESKWESEEADEDLKPPKKGQKPKVEEQWEPQDPKNPPKDDQPQWGDLGEDGHTVLPIEDLINPRLRPKRFIESKIYHVPLTFRSNAKPYLVKIKSKNTI